MRASNLPGARANLTRPLAAVSALALLSMLVLLSGCSHDAPPEMASGPPKSAMGGGGGAGAKTSGAIPDDKVYPAPAGVKTGLEGGGAHRGGR